MTTQPHAADVSGASWLISDGGIAAGTTAEGELFENDHTMPAIIAWLLGAPLLVIIIIAILF